MNIKIFRIDDRLIHGQVATSWVGHANAKQIVVVDDEVVNDTLQKSLLKMATPKGVELKLFSIEEAKEELEKTDDNGSETLFLVKSPVTASKLLDDNTKVKEINVGNLNMRKGKEKVLDNLWVYPEDIEAFKKLDSLGINLEYRTLPNDSKKSVMSLLS